MSRKKAIGILGGTFDPIHFGHLRSALEIYQQLNFDEMRLIPCKQPPHRTQPFASAADRLAMTRIAVEQSPLMVDDREMHRDGPSYSVDTLLSLRQEYPEASLCFVIGLDAFLNLPTWHKWEKIIQLANIIVMHRGNWSIPTTGTISELLTINALKSSEKILDFSCGKVLEQSITPLNISASNIRSMLQSRISAEFLLPKPVLNYIHQHHLYVSNNQFSIQSTEVTLL